jgi:DNA (cytosine-5)-methyltransferase 1
LALVALGIVARLKPRWFVFENVPGLMSSDEGRDFGAFLGLVDELGYSACWSRLDAQHFGVAQRRERVFVVGHLGDWRGPAAVLLEPEGLRGHHPPSRQKGERVAPTIEARANAGGAGWGTDFMTGGGIVDAAPDLAWALQERDAKGSDSSTKDGHLIVAADLRNGAVGDLAHSLQSGGKDGERGRCINAIPHIVAGTLGQRSVDHTSGLKNESEFLVADPISANEGKTYTHKGKNNFRLHNVVPHAIGFTQNSRSEVREIGGDGSIVGAVAADAGAQQQNYVAAFQTRIARYGRGQPEEIVPSLNGSDAGATSDMRPCVATPSAVRRLTPTECERLQGFPDHYTQVKFRGKAAADGPRYRALGNSMAVPVIGWILNRIEMLEGKA